MSKTEAKLENIYLPHASGQQFGVLRIWDGPMRNTHVAFRSQDCYVTLRHLRYVDLRRMNFGQKDRFFVEYREINDIEAVPWKPIFQRAFSGKEWQDLGKTN